jgi:sugar lactone lactonase YvrE
MATRLAAVVAAALCVATGALAVSGNGTIHTVAGTGAAGFSGDGGRATSARLNAPAGVAVDGAGNLYVADSGNHRIRKVTPGGVITTIAGTSSGGFSGDGGPATAAQLFSPQGVALDGAGNLYVADTGNNRIRRIAGNGTISTVAGNGVEDQTADGAPATQAALNEPNAVAVDSEGTVYIAEEDRVVRIATDGTIRTVAGAVYSSGYNGDGIPAVSAELDSPSGLAVDAAGNVYISDTDNQRVRRVGTDGIIRTFAGTGNGEFSGDGGPATAARINGPYGLAVGTDGSVYLADRYNNRVRKILPNGTIITVAGGGSSRRQFGPATRAELDDPVGAAVDRAGNLLLADTSANRVHRVADLRAELGTVGRAWVSSTRAGSASRRLSSESREIWAHFVFAEQPAVGLPIVVEFYSPRRRLAAVQKPRASRVDVVLRRQRNAVFALGRWRAVLRVAGRPVKTVPFEVRPFGIG